MVRFQCVAVALLLCLQVCGRAPFNTRIVGGQSSSEGGWPWQVSLQSPDYNGHFCGGTLINKDFVLTAAHCFSSTISSAVTVYLGKQTLTGSNPNQITRGVTQVIVHPSYNSATQNNDIALLRLNSSVNFTDYIRPVCLAGQGSSFPDKTSCWITGWGSIASGVQLPAPGVLQEAMVPTVNTQICDFLLGFGSITPNMMCAGYYQGGKDTCQGDSGGPLVTKQGAVWVQAGITSWGRGCALSYSPGVYTQVSQYQSWLSSVIGQNLPGFIYSCGCSWSAVVSIYQKCSKDGTVVNRRQGHVQPKNIDARGGRRLVRVVRSNRRAPVAQTDEEVHAVDAPKKTKKKGKTLTLTDFLAEDSSGSAPQAYPAVKPTSWADETEDLDGEVSTSWHTAEDSYRAPPIDRSILPTAPRAAREPNVDRSRLPRSPPYTAFLGNLPYDVSEESIKQFFRGLAISAVRLPREPSNPERLKGFGYAEFDDVESLLSALTLNEERDGGMMSGRDRDRGRGIDSGPDKTDSDWRARPSGDQDEGFGEKSRDRFESRRDDRFGGRDRFDDRDRRDRYDDRERYDDRGGRDYERGGYDSRSGGGGRRAFGSGYRRDFDDRRDGDRYGEDRYERRDERRDERREERAPLQRPKLNLKPRSVPKEEEPSGGGLSPQTNPSRSASIFGAAKPVDTAAKEREVEERLKKEQDRMHRQLDEDKSRPPERRPRDRHARYTVEPHFQKKHTAFAEKFPAGERFQYCCRKLISAKYHFIQRIKSPN
ncbi:eukaryotic translation initiation factor 4B isoform X2 [Silurus meridionalis]|nr:eukaryotic translation initiation factor 4B isoform X2 [Silurus meridionalis]